MQGQLGLPFPLPFSANKSVDTVVVGAGISGLAYAHARGPGAALAVLEAAPRPGGLMWTEAGAACALEIGPETLAAGAPETERMLAELGLPARRAPVGSKRYVVRRGALAPLPASPTGLLATPLLSWRGKLRLASEPWRDPAAGLEGSLADFVRQRLGPEALAAFVDPFVSGIFAGDPEQLSLEAVFPELRGLVREHGSMWAGLRARAARARGRRGSA